MSHYGGDITPQASKLTSGMGFGDYTQPPQRIEMEDYDLYTTQARSLVENKRD